MRVDPPRPPGSARPVEVFVDYDGTITDGDTFDVLVRRFAGDEEWLRIEAALDARTMSLRAALALEASHVRLDFAEAEALLDREIAYDPSFTAFVRHCERAGIAVSVVSSGIEPLIVNRLARNGVGIPVIANGVEPLASGWKLSFRDPVDNGTDKAGIVRAARARGSLAIFVGDGRSDFDGMLEADRRFVKRGKILERLLVERGIAFESFDDFHDIARALLTPAL